LLHSCVSSEFDREGIDKFENMLTAVTGLLFFAEYSND
jgi:hypothetical protein